MDGIPFGWGDLYAGSRFCAPVSESALLEAGRAAGIGEGATVLDLACGNAACALFWAEEFHAYVRGVEEDPDLLRLARRHAGRSAAGRRFLTLAAPPDAPVDIVCALRGALGGDPGALARPGGRILLGRCLAPPGLALPFPAAPRPATAPVWRRDATPLEWERFLAPQERALRVYRRRLAPGDPVAPLALEADRWISAFRAHAFEVRYELCVCEVG